MFARAVWLVPFVVACTPEVKVSVVPPEPSLQVVIDTAETGDTGEIEVPPPEDTAEDDPVPVATAKVYANTRDTLYELDPATGATTMVGQFTFNGEPFSLYFHDIAIDLQGRLYGGARAYEAAIPWQIYRIDPATAEVFYVCESSVDMVAMTFLSDGRMIVGGDSTLEVIHLDDGCSSEVIINNSQFVTSGDVVGLPDGLLYWTVRGVNEEDSDRLIAVDVDSQLYAERGSMPFEKLYGLGYDEGTESLYGFSSDGEIVEVTPADADAQLLSSDEERSWWGAATNPVVWAAAE